jgi:hypothetical protein
MQQIYRVEEKTLVDGSRIEQFVREAGFIDIKVKVKKFELGAWGPGISLWVLLMVDERKHYVAKECAKVWAEAMESNAQRMTRYYPNAEERCDFAQDVKADVLNPKHHLYSKTYVILCRGVDSRYIVTGRKAPVVLGKAVS